MATPHIAGAPGDFAKTVLMPGDPLRAKFIAETYFENPVLVNNIRGVQGYTGTWNGTRVSVMASGMGMPSMAIYSYELFKFFDVDNIIRIGTAGAISDALNLRDIVAGIGACTNSAFAAQARQSPAHGLNAASASSAEQTKRASARCAPWRKSSVLLMSSTRRPMVRPPVHQKPAQLRGSLGRSKGMQRRSPCRFIEQERHGGSDDGLTQGRGAVETENQQ